MTERLCILGTGMIGCSFASALKLAGFSGEIVGHARTQASLDEAIERGYLDSASTVPAESVRGSDLVMLTVPMQSMGAVLHSVVGELGSKTIITDGGSVKGHFIREARAVLSDLSNVVPGHPIAGLEKTGVAAADGTLYRNRRVILTPLPESRQDAIDEVKRLWAMTGANVECLEPEHHDRVLAATSHLPHVLAFSLMDLLSKRQESEEIFRYAAGGFRDFTRIAASDPVMWRDVCLTNQQEISEIMQALIENLGELKTLIDVKDGEALYRLFEQARDTRDSYTEMLK